MLSEKFKSKILKGIDLGNCEVKRAEETILAVKHIADRLIEGLEFIKSRENLEHSLGYHRTDSDTRVYIGLSTYRATQKSDGIEGLEIELNNPDVIKIIGNVKGTYNKHSTVLQECGATEEDMVSILHSVAKKAVLDKQALAFSATPGLKPLL